MFGKQRSMAWQRLDGDVFLRFRKISQANGILPNGWYGSAGLQALMAIFSEQFSKWWHDLSKKFFAFGLTTTDANTKLIN